MPPKPASDPTPLPDPAPEPGDTEANDTGPPTIRLRVRPFVEQCLLRGWYTSSAQARALGLSPQSLWRTVEGRHGIGSTFIAACLQAFPHLGFDDFFEVIDGDGEPDRISEELSA